MQYSQNNIINLVNDMAKRSQFQSRYERKSKINVGQSNFFKGVFNLLGFYKCYEKRKISSIYFDDYNYSFAQSNIDGDFYRLKPRIRWYNDNFDNSNFEFKYKLGFNGFKSKDNSLDQTNLNFENKLDFTRKKLLSNYNLNLFLCANVIYQREYFRHSSGIRLTFDKEISCSLINFDQNKYEFKQKHIKLPFEVLEFKYPFMLDNTFREEIFPKLQDFPIRLTKCSKYAESIIALNTL